jgi:hypothetical protein
MLAITDGPPAGGCRTGCADLDGDAFETAASDGTTIRVTGDVQAPASFFAALRVSGIEHVTVTRGRGDGGAEDVFRDALDTLGIEVEIVRMRQGARRRMGHDEILLLILALMVLMAGWPVGRNGRFDREH